MSKNAIIGIIVVVIVIVGGYFVFGKQAVAPSQETSNPASDTYLEGTDILDTSLDINIKRAATVITFTDSGYSPSPVTIKVGDTVTFKNQSSMNFWPASAMHPTHIVYDGTTLQQHCAQGATESFDACHGIVPGGDYSFTFQKAGTWSYHDHLTSKYFGKIIVE